MLSAGEMRILGRQTPSLIAFACKSWLMKTIEGKSFGILKLSAVCSRILLLPATGERCLNSISGLVKFHAPLSSDSSITCLRQAREGIPWKPNSEQNLGLMLRNSVKGLSECQTPFFWK